MRTWTPERADTVKLVVANNKAARFCDLLIDASGSLMTCGTY